MKKSLLISIAAFLAAVPAHAMQSAPVDGSAALEAWRATHGSAWQVALTPHTSRVALLFGGGAAAPFRPRSDQEWVTVARYFLTETEPIHGVAGGTLKRDRVTFLPLGQGSTTDKLTVHFRQEVGGVPVAGAAMNVLMDLRGTLLSVQNVALSELDGVNTQPALSGGFAVASATSAFERRFGAATFIGEPELVLAPSSKGELVTTLLVWRVVVRQEVPGSDPIGFEYSIDAVDGEVVGSETVIHYDVSGTVMTNATPGVQPDTAGNPPVQQPAAYAQLTSTAGTVTADANGNFNFPGATGPLTVTAEFVGQFNEVFHDTGPEHTVTVSINDGDTILLNPSPTELITAQANAYIHIGILNDWIHSIFPTDTTADFQAVSNVNLDANCNAFFNGGSINFYTSGGNCVNTAYSTIVAHEFGHWLNILYGTGNGSDGMGEGNSDVFAMYLYDRAIVGANFSGGGFIRTGNNLRQYCGECAGGCYGGVHADGEVWMGAAWKVRQNLNTTHGDAPGDFIADTLFLGWMNSYNQTQIDEMIEIQWLTLNDDDADITNGTPDYADIDAGFLTQGFPGYVLPFLNFTNVTELPDTDLPGPYLVSADITATFNPPVASATLRYKVGGGSFIDAPMTNTVGDTYEASIPNQIAPAIVDYYVTATDNLGVAQSFPADAPSDILSFDIGTLVIVTSDDFEGASDNGWTVGVPSDDATTGIWERVNPVGTAAQPENDHSMPGTMAWITGQQPGGGSLGTNDVDNGKTTLLSPVFDLSGLGEPVVSYWLWYSNTTGAAPNADIFEVDISGDGGGTWSSAEVVGPSGCESNGGWIEHSFRVTDVMAPTATMRLRFVASDEGSGSLVEAALDDFAITYLDAPACPPPTSYCTGAPNSVGSGAQIGQFGSQSVSSNTFGLLANGLPPGQNGIFFYGPGQTSSVFGNGTLCIGGMVQRLDVVQSDAFGVATFAVDLTSPPTASGQITSGSTWNFQHWYRDPAAGGAFFNLSDALEVTFCD